MKYIKTFERPCYAPGVSLIRVILSRGIVRNLHLISVKSGGIPWEESPAGIGGRKFHPNPASIKI